MRLSERVCMRRGGNVGGMGARSLKKAQHSLKKGASASRGMLAFAGNPVALRHVDLPTSSRCNLSVSCEGFGVTGGRFVGAPSPADAPLTGHLLTDVAGAAAALGVQIEGHRLPFAPPPARDADAEVVGG